MAENNDIITGEGIPNDVSNYVPGNNTYLNYGPNLLPVADLPRYEDYPIPTGPAPNFKDPFMDVNNQFMRDLNGAFSLRDYKKQGNIDYFPAESLNFDRYVDPEGAWAFGDTTGGFVPWRDNEAVHNSSTNFLKEMYRSTSWAAPLYFDGFTSGLRSFPDLLDGIFTGDWDSFLSTDDAVAEKWSRATRMGSSTYGPASSFFTNFEISAAHMLGTVTEIAAENAVLAFIEGASFGGATPAVAARFSMNMGRGFRALSQAYRNISKVSDIFSDANTARKVFYNAAKLGGGTLKFFSPLRNSTDLVRGVYSGNETFNAVRAFGAAYRDLREINFALSEAKLEGGFQKLQLKDDLTRDYVNRYGALPEGETALKIQEAADASANFTTKFNLPIIYYSNRIGFGNLFRGNNTINNLIRGGASNSVFNSIRFNTSKQLFEAVNPLNIKNAFRYGLGNSINYFKANVMEGIQENLQETIGGASYDYYYKRFYNPSYGGMNTMLGDLSKNLGDQFSSQGLSTFLSGALMGTIPAAGSAFSSGVENLAFRYTNKEKYQEFQNRRKELVNRYVTQLNEVYKDPLKFFDPELLNAVRQAELGKFLTQSTINQNDKNFHDVKDQAVYEHLMTVLRSGKVDLFRDKINNFRQLDGDELTAAIGFNVEEAGKLKERLNQTLSRLDKLEERYNEQQDKLPNPINLTAYKQGTKEYEDAAIKYMAWENAREQAIFMGYSFDRTAERMVDLLGRFKNIKKTAKGNYIDLAVTTNPDLYNNEIKLLEDEIASLKLGDADSKKLAALKEDRLQALKKWKNAVESPGGNPLTVKVTTPAITPDGGIYPVDYPTAVNPAYENYRNLAKLAFERLVEVEAGASKDAIFREGVDEGFNILMDFLELSNEQARLTEAINTLADPDNFLKLYDGHYGVMKDIYNRRAQVIIEAVEKGLQITDKNDLIHKLLRLKHPTQTAGVDTYGYVEDPQNPGRYYKIVNDQIIPVEPGSEDFALIKQVVDEHNKATETETRKREEAKQKAAKEAADRARAAAEEPKKTAQASEVEAEKGSSQGTYTPDQSYYNAAHKVVPKEIEYSINYNPNGSIKSIVWNFKGSDTKNVEKSISTESEFKQLMDLNIAKTYFQTLLAGKMNRSNMKYDKKEDMHTGFIDSILTNKDAFNITLNLSPDVEQELFDNISVEGLDKQNYDALSKAVQGTIKGIIADIEKQIADKQKAFTATKQSSDPKFITSVENTTVIFSTNETSNEMRDAVLTRTPDNITSNATLKVVRLKGIAEPKVVFFKNNGAFKVLRQNPPISSELYIGGKLVGFPTYHDVYTFEINGVVKTVDQLTKTEYAIFANPEAGSYEDFKNNYLNSKAVYEAIKLKLGDKETTELSSEEVKKIMTITPRQGDYIFTDEEHQLFDLETVTKSVMIAVIDKKALTEPILRGTTATEINDSRTKLNTLLGKIDFAEKTKNQGRYIAVFELPNGNPALVEVSSGYLASEEKDELFADIKSELENTFKKNVEVTGGKRISKNPEFTRDFDESLSQRVFIAVPATQSSLGYGIRLSLTSAGDLKLNFDNYKDRNYTVYVDIPYDKSNKAIIKGFDDMLSRMNQSIVAFNANNPDAELPTIKGDYFKNSIPANTNFTQITKFFTNVDPLIFKNTSMRFTPTSDVVKDVMPVASKKTGAKKVKFPEVQGGAVTIKEEVDPNTIDSEDLKGAKKKTASKSKQGVLQPNQSPLAQAAGTARVEPVITEVPPVSNIKGALAEQGTSIELEVIGETGKEFLLTVDRNGNISLFSEKQPDGSYKSGDPASKEAIINLYKKYVPSNTILKIQKWLASFTGSWAAPETEDGKNYERAEKELSAELAALERIKKATIQMQPANIEKIKAGTKTTTTRSESQSKQINIPVGQSAIVNFGGQDFKVTNRGLLTIEEAGGKEAIIKSEGVKSEADFMYQQTKDWVNGKGKLYVYDIAALEGAKPVVTEVSKTPTSIKISDIKSKYDALKADLATKYTDAAGNITNIVEYNKELTKISNDEQNELAKLAAQRKKPILKVSDRQYYDEQDIVDLSEFKNWMETNMPDIFTVEEMNTVMENLTNNKVVLGRFVSYVKTMSDESRRVVGVIQTSPSAQFKYHEAFHGIFRLLLTDAQIDRMLSLGKYELLQKLKKKGVTLQARLAEFRTEHPSYLELTDKQLEDRLVEEYLADKFDEFKLNRKGVLPKKGDENFIQYIFNKIREFISRLLNRSYDIQNLFEQIDRGKFKSANIQNNRFTRELADIPYVEVYKIAYGYDVIADTQGNEISIKKYLNESDTNAIVSAAVNSFLQRVENMKEFNKNSVLESILNDYQQLYQFGRYADQKMTVEKNARLRMFNQVFTNPEAREDIKRNINVYLNLLGFQQELDSDEFDTLADDVGDREVAGQYGDSFGQGGYKSLSKYLRLYIQSTVKEQGDEFGNLILNPETDEKVYMGVNAGVVYNGLVKVLSGVTTSDKFIRRLLSFRTGNPDSAAFINKFIQDTGLEFNEQTGEWSISQNQRLFNSVFKGFTLFRVDYEDLIIDPKKKVAFFVRSNAKDAASNQYNRWQSDFEFYYQDQLNPEKKKMAIETLARLNDPLKSNISVTDDELETLAEDLRVLQKVTGISISPVYYSYSVAKALQARKMELSANMNDLIVAYDGVVPISPDDFTAIIKTLNENNNPFISFDDFVKQQAADEDAMFDDEAEADAELEEDTITDDEASKLAEDLERIAKIGNRSRLIRIAENNAMFDESVLSTSFENAEGESVTSHQYPTFHLAYLEDVIKNKSEILKKIEADPHLADSYLGKQLLQDGDLSKILSRLKITRMGGLRQISALVTKEGKIIEDKRRQVNRREGVVYGKFGDRELITALLSQYLLKEEQVAVPNPEAKSGYDYITTTRHLIRVIESKNTGDTINLPVIKSVYGKGDSTKLTEEAKSALMDEFLSEYNRISRVANEDNLGNVISDYNDSSNPNSKMRGLKLRNFTAILGDRAEYYEQRARSGNPTLTQEEMNEVGFLTERFLLGDPENGVKGLVDQFVDVMVNAGIVERTVKDGKEVITNVMLPTELYGTRAAKPTARMNRLNLVGGFRANIAQVVINDYINTMSFNKLYYGDQAATLKDFIDSVKRAAGSNAQGYNMYSDVMAPELGITHMHKNSVVSIHADPVYASKHGGDQNQKLADGQTWTTTKAFRYNQFSLGRLDAYKASVLDKIDQGIPLTSEEIFGINGTIRNNAQLKVEKIVYDDGVMYIKTSAFVLTKEFTSVLTPEAKARIAELGDNEAEIKKIRLDNANWQARPNMVDLHNKRVALEAKEQRSNTVAYSIPESAAKMLRINVSESITDFDVDDIAYYTLDNRYMRLQVENPTNKNKITDPTQAMQIIDTEQFGNTPVQFRNKETKVKAVADIYQTSVAQKVQISYVNARNSIFDMADMRNQFTISTETGKITPELGKFQKRAVETLKKTGASSQLIDFFDVIEDPETGELIPRYDLNHPYTANKYEELFLAYFRRGVLSQQVPGHALTLVSGFGIKKIKRARIVIEGVPVAWDVISDAEYEANPEAYRNIKDITQTISEGEYFLDELRHNVRTYDDQGNLLKDVPAYTEFMMPAHFREFMDLKPGEKIPEEILKAFGSRTPGQDLHSLSNLKLVDFMPAYYGSSGVFAKEMVEIMGADFDVDKLYTQIADFYTKNTINRETGNVERKLIAYGYSREDNFAEYIIWNAKNNGGLKDYIAELKEKDPRYERITALMDNIHTLRSEIYNNRELLRDSLEQLEDSNWLLGTVATDPSYDFTITVDPEVIDPEEYMKMRSMGAEVIRTKIMNLDERIKETINEIKRSGARAFGLTETLRDLRFEKQAIDQFILFEAMEYMKMPITRQAFETQVKRRGEMNIGRLNNLILDSKYALLGNSGVVDSGIAFEPANERPLEVLETDPDIIAGVRQEINLDNDHMLGKVVAYRNNKEGQKNVGSAVNAMISYTVAHKFGLEVRTKLVEVDGEERDVIYKLEIDGVSFNNYKNTRTATIENGKVVQKFTGGRIMNVISALITAMTDNAKNRRSAKLNLNINAVGFVADLVGRGVPEKLAVGLILNPAVKEYYNRVSEKKYKIQTKRLDTRRDIATGILKALEARAGYKPGEGEIKPLTAKSIFDAINNPSDSANLFSVFSHFLFLENQNYSFSALAQLMKMTKGPGTELAEWDKLKNNLRNNLGIGLDDDAFEKTNLPFDARRIIEGANKIATVYWDVNTQLYDELAKTMFISRSNVFKQVFSAASDQFNVPYFLQDMFNSKLKNNLTLFFGMKSYLKSLRDRGDELASLITNNLVYNTEDGSEDIVKIVNYGRSILPKNYLLNKYINAIPQGKVQGGKLILNKDNKKGISHLSPSSWGKLDPFQLEKLQNSFVELYADERTRRIALALFAYTIVKDGTMYRADGLMRVFPPFMFDELMGDIMFNVRNLFSQDTLERYEEDGDKFEAFQELFGTDFKGVVEQFIKMYSTHITNKFYVKKVLIGDVEDVDVGKPIRYARKQNGEVDNSAILFDLFIGVRNLVMTKEFIQGEFVDVLTRPSGKLGAGEKANLKSNIRALVNRGFEVKEISKGSGKLGIVLPYVIKVSDKSVYVLQNMGNVKDNNQFEEVPLAKMFNKDYQFVGARAVYRKMDWTGVNAQVPIAELFGEVPTAEKQRKYWRGINLEEMGTRAFPKGRATIIDESGAVVNIDTYNEIQEGAPTVSAMEPTEYADGVTSPDTTVEAFVEPTDVAPKESTKTVKTQLEDLGYKVSIVDKVVLITKDGKQQNRKGETAQKFLDRIKGVITPIVKGVPSKVVEGDIFVMQGIPVITTNLPGVHGAGLAQLAKNKGLIVQGDGAFKITDKVVQLPVKGMEPTTRRAGAGAFSEKVIGKNIDLLKEGLDKLVEAANADPTKTYLLPLAGLGHGEGSVADILPLLINAVKSAINIKLVLPGEDVNLGRKGTVRVDATRAKLPEIKAMLQKAGLLATTQPEVKTGKKKVKFPKLTEEQSKKLGDMRDKLDKGDFDADEIVKCPPGK